MVKPLLEEKGSQRQIFTTITTIKDNIVTCNNVDIDVVLTVNNVEFKKTKNNHYDAIITVKIIETLQYVTRRIWCTCPNTIVNVSYETAILPIVNDKWDEFEVEFLYDVNTTCSNYICNNIAKQISHTFVANINQIKGHNDVK